jgi:hypothetical protein
MPGADDTIDLKTRYEAASIELSQRIGTRHTSYLGHAAACAAVLSLYLATPTATAGSAAQMPFRNVLLALCPAAIGLAFGCWIRSQDLTVGMLSTFCRLCENSSEGTIPPDQPPKPAWHCKRQGWQQTSMRHREWIEIAFILLNAFIVEASTFYFVGPFDTKSLIPTTATLVLSLSHFVLGFSCWMVLSIREYRERLLESTFEGGRFHNPPIENAPHPIEFTGLVAFVAALFILLEKLSSIWTRDDSLHRAWPAIVTLLVAATIKIFSFRLDRLLRREFYNGVEFRKDTWYSSYWAIPVLLSGLAIALLCMGWSNRYGDLSFHLALWIMFGILGYTVPEAIMAGDRWRKLLLKRSPNKLSYVLASILVYPVRKHQRADKITITIAIEGRHDV